MPQTEKVTHPEQGQRRLRRQLDEAVRYSRFVALMRWTLPTAAAVMLLMLFAWPNQMGIPASLPREMNAGQREMINPRYQGLNNRGEPMVVTAARAIQVGSVEDAIDLLTVEAHLSRKGGGWVTLAAENGRYDQAANRISLAGQVRLRDSDGYDVLTDRAEISLNSPAQAWGENKVTGRGPRGTINANGFRVTDEGRTVILTGRPRLVGRQDAK